jgi:hypothetical protein
VTNQFATGFTVTLMGDSSEYPHLRYEDGGGDNSTTLGPGEAASFDAIVTCKKPNEADSRTVDVTVTAEGDGVSAEVTREVTVKCEPNAGNNGQGPNGNNGQGPNAGNNSKGPNGNSSRA